MNDRMDEKKEAFVFMRELLFGPDDVSGNLSLFLLWTNAQFAIIIKQNG